MSRSENGIAARMKIETGNTPNVSRSMNTVWREARAWVLAARLECLSLIASIIGPKFQHGLLEITPLTVMLLSMFFYFIFNLTV